MIKSAIITGASGFIGKQLTRVLLAQGVRVTAIVPDPENMTDFNDNCLFDVIKASFDDFQHISNAVIHKEADVFFYLAWFGYGSATNDYEIQILNIKPVCDAVTQAALMGCKRFVFTSSFSEYMIKENEKLTHDEGAACNVYGSVKNAARIVAHAVASQKGIPFLSVAFANTFGPGDYSKRSTNSIIMRLLNGIPLDITEGIHLYDWNFIDDTVRGLILAGEHGKPDSLYYIGNNQRRPLRDIIVQVRDIVNKDVPINFGTYKEDFHVDYSCIDVHRLYRDSGYLAMCDFKDSIFKLVTWLKEINSHK